MHVSTSLKQTHPNRIKMLADQQHCAKTCSEKENRKKPETVKNEFIPFLIKIRLCLVVRRMANAPLPSNHVFSVFHFSKWVCVCCMSFPLSVSIRWVADVVIVIVCYIALMCQFEIKISFAFLALAFVPPLQAS